jgi:hypothetical protein
VNQAKSLINTAYASGNFWGEECLSAIHETRWNHIQSCKEAIRHTLYCLGLTSLLRHRQIARGFNAGRYLRDSPAETFRTIYLHKGWVHAHEQESRSGIGSSSKITTGLLDRINAAMQHLGAKSLIDVGCGDWHWMKCGTLHCDYTGLDVVPEIILANRRHQQSNVRFSVCDAIAEPLPIADVALCREVLFHLSFADVRAAVKNIKAASRYLLATTDLDIAINSNVTTGDFRRINLMRRPFSFPAPIGLIPDQGLVSSRYLGIWESPSLP